MHPRAAQWAVAAVQWEAVAAAQWEVAAVEAARTAAVATSEAVDKILRITLYKLYIGRKGYYTL